MYTKKRLYLLAVTLCVVTLLIFGCATPTPTQAPTQAPTPTPTQTPVELKLAFHATTGNALADSIEWWASEVEKRTNGMVKTKIYYGGSLVGATEMLDAARMGTADLATIINVYFLDAIGLSLYYDPVPFEPTHCVDFVEPSWKLFDEFPEMGQQFLNANQRMVSIMMSSNVDIISKQPMKGIGDFKGKKIRAWGSYLPKWFSAVGAVPVSMPAVDVYDALAKGTVDAAPAGLETIYRYKWQESAKNLLSWGRGAGPYYNLTINLSTWEKLTPNTQQVMLEVGREATLRQAKGMDAEVSTAMEEMKKAGVTFVDFPASDKAQWKSMPACQETMDSWVKTMEDKGLPGRKVMDRFLKLINW